MIKIRKSRLDKFALYFEFDLNAAVEMRDIFSNLKIVESRSVRVLFMVGKKNSEYDFSVILSDDESLLLRQNCLVLSIDEDSREHGLYLLNGYIENGYFPIAEFCEVYFDFLKSDVMLYFHIEKISED